MILEKLHVFRVTFTYGFQDTKLRFKMFMSTKSQVD